MKIIVTGGAGYIGSHTVIELIAAGHEPIIIDTFTNSFPAIIERLQAIAQRPIASHRLDLLDQTGLLRVLKEVQPEAVIHFAGLKSVPESIVEPHKYYRTNFGTTLNLLHAMQAAGCKRLVFSSSAAVYGHDAVSPIHEETPPRPASPYGHTKLTCEQLLRDVTASNPQMIIRCLRYFNPVGAHPSGLIGESPRNTPTNLWPLILQAATGDRPYLEVYGDNFDTPDGTAIRDYFHVQDLARAHVLAVSPADQANFDIYNLGSGRGYSVKQVLSAFETLLGREIPHKIQPRRPGDVAVCYADTTKVQQRLSWQTKYGLDEMCRDAWRWHETSRRDAIFSR